MCAAPGGKTTHLAQLVGPEGRVVAFDKSQNKINQERVAINMDHSRVDISLQHKKLRKYCRTSWRL